ncbi:response regulator [Escherichia coli]|uniref:response regulator n=1 Tax=Escherichia coli TaxID=562 RepID=UPI0035170141
METLKPDIVIIDVDIPGVNGIQVFANVRSANIAEYYFVSAKNDHFYGKHAAADAGA